MVFTLGSRRAARFAAAAAVVGALAGCAGDSKTPLGPPAPPSWSISGAVSGAVTAGVTVRIQGGSRTATTDAQGQYEIGGLFDGTYTLEASRDGFAFTPATRTVTVSGASVPGQDFTAQRGLGIAGKVTGDAHAGVTLTLLGPDPVSTTRTTTTDAEGNYLFSNVTAGSYLVTPSLAGGWTFSPANTAVTVAASSLTGPDFASIPPTHRLSGRITGAFTSGVVVTLSGDAGAVAVTDGAGNYAFAGLAPGSYVVRPSYPGYAFTPAERAATISGADVPNQGFTAAATHTIAGRVSGDVLAGVQVTLSGAGAGTATTDASGYFELADLADGVYTVAPSRGGYTFAPAQRSVTLSGANVTGASFTASSAATYTVSGALTGAALGGVTVTLEGATTAAVTADPAGAFRLDGVAPGTYLLVPTHDDYTFTPASRLVVVSAADVTGQAFAAALKPAARTISGAVTGAASAGVTVTLVGPSPAATTLTTTTDAAGGFAFRGLADGLYLATPSRAGFVFTPADCLVSVAGPSVTDVQFTSTPALHAISGRVSGPTGVMVSLSGNATRTATTAGDGSYAFTGLANGAYAVRPTLAGHAFSPVEAAVTLDGANVTSVDFVGAATHRISGHVSGAVLAGVKVKLGGAAEAEATTDGTGLYTFTDLRDGGYVLTPSRAGYTFDPQLFPVALAGADVTTADFVATLVTTYTVSGTVSGAVSAGVTVRISGEATQTTTTDGGGAFLFSGLPDGSYMVVPSAGGVTFTPASRGFRINGANVSGQSFTSAAAP